jgi:Flp pilus assembly protein CpaB
VENIMSSKLLTTRRGTIILGIGAAVLAAIVLLVYLNQYRNSVNTNASTVSVLVAKSLIQKGTPGNIVGSTGLYQVSSIPRTQIKTGAFVDPKTLAGKVAVADVYPGQQITADDFVIGTGSLTQSLARDQRAVVVPLDSPAEVGGQIAAGDHVDVWVAFSAQGANGVSRPIVREVLQDIYVMNAGGATGGSVTIRATPRQAGELIYASQNAKLWLVLRPAIASKNTTKPPVISANDLLGLPSIRVGG